MVGISLISWPILKVHVNFTRCTALYKYSSYGFRYHVVKWFKNMAISFSLIMLTKDKFNKSLWE